MKSLKLLVNMNILFPAINVCHISYLLGTSLVILAHLLIFENVVFPLHFDFNRAVNNRDNYHG